MRGLDLSRFTVGDDYTVWPIDFAMSASFELPLARVRAALPARVQPFEARPGVGLLNLTVFNFTADAPGLSAPCTEIALSVHVIPDLTHALMLPRVSLFTFRLGASSREFIDSLHATDQFPICPDPIDARIDRDRIAVSVRDQAGRALFDLAAADGVSPRYEDDRYYVQSTTTRDGRLLTSGNLFELRRAENQRRLETAGAPVPHPFFDGIDVSGMTARHGYLQMWTEPGSIGREHHFLLKPLD
jgi:hypothetical protein